MNISDELYLPDPLHIGQVTMVSLVREFGLVALSSSGDTKYHIAAITKTPMTKSENDISEKSNFIVDKYL